MAKIAWFIPTLIEGSGGHRTMLQHASFLEGCGHECHIYLEDEFGIEDASKRIKNLFGYNFKNAFYSWKKSSDADVAIATIWYSAGFVRDLNYPCKKVYFVQDYEAYFNPMGDSFLLAENSYSYGLIPVTIGRWLRHELKMRFNVNGYHFEFGANTKIYRPDTTKSQIEKSVCFIYQPDKPRRCAQLGLEALGILKHRMPEVKIYLYGSSAKGNIWFKHEHLGLLDLNACNALYNKCSVGLCISSSNPSRIPFEMMSAGLPVVEIYRENNLYDFPENGVSLCKQNAESLAQGMIDILIDDNKQARMSAAGSKFMQDRPLEMEMQQFSAALNAIIEGVPLPKETIEQKYLSPPIISASHYEVPSEYKSENVVAHRHAKLKTLASMLPPSLRNLLRRAYFTVYRR